MPRDTIRERILKERGLVMTKPGHRRRRIYKVTPDTKSIPKTSKMQLMEMKYGRGGRLEDILMTGSLNQIVKKFHNEVDRSTVSKWIDRLKLVYTKNNLPTCSTCHHKQLACDGGICTILMEREQYDLVKVKQNQVLNGTLNVH